MWVACQISRDLRSVSRWLATFVGVIAIGSDVGLLETRHAAPIRSNSAGSRSGPQGSWAASAGNDPLVNQAPEHPLDVAFHRGEEGVLGQVVDRASSRPGIRVERPSRWASQQLGLERRAGRRHADQGGSGAAHQAVAEEPIFAGDHHLAGCVRLTSRAMSWKVITLSSVAILIPRTSGRARSSARTSGSRRCRRRPRRGRIARAAARPRRFENGSG